MAQFPGGVYFQPDDSQSLSGSSQVYTPAAIGSPQRPSTPLLPSIDSGRYSPAVLMPPISPILIHNIPPQHCIYSNYHAPVVFRPGSPVHRTSYSHASGSPYSPIGSPIIQRPIYNAPLVSPLITASQSFKIPKGITKHIRPLGPIRSILDEVVGRPEYMMDPLCPSNIDFLRRGIDEATKFFYLVIEEASRMELGIRYEQSDVQDKRKKELRDDFSVISASSRFDFRWQMKNFHFNSTKYKRLFKDQISVEKLKKYTIDLLEVAGSLFHQQNLADNFTERMQAFKVSGKCGTVTQIKKFFTLVNELINLMVNCFKKQETLKKLHIHCENIQEIYQSFLDFIEYRDIHQHNMTIYQSMDRKLKKDKSKQILQILENKINDERSEHDWDEWMGMILVRFAAHMNLKIDSF
jgi:hypothetical protein